MDFSVFDTKKMDEYARQAKEQWGKTPEYAEFEEKSRNRSREEERTAAEGMMQLFADFGKQKDRDPEDAQIQELVKRLQEYITENFYTCSNEILSGLGKMYAAGGEFTENIDRAGGKGTAELVAEAIRIFCGE